MIPLDSLKTIVKNNIIMPFFLQEKSQYNQKLRELDKYFYGLAGKRFSEYDAEKPISIVEDFRLGRSFEAAFSRYYIWKQPELGEAAGEEDIKKMTAKGIMSSQDLRLFAYGKNSGFSEDRAATLDLIKKELGITADPDDLLWLDREDFRKLVKMRQFDLKDFISYYNREALDTMFYNSQKIWIRSPDFDKRLIYYAKEAGVALDIEKGYTYVLEGPIELFGRPAKYGYRIASYLARALPTLKDWQLESLVIIKGKRYLFRLDSIAFANLVFEEASENEDREFDSFPEQQLFESFSGNYASWEIIREPEPIVYDDVLAVPDFVISRGDTRIYTEVVGYWTDDYKRRKLDKLTKLKAHGVNLILLIEKKYEEEAKKSFSSIGFDIIFYDFSKKPSAIPLLKLLEEKYSDYASRANVRDRASAALRITEKGFASAKELMEGLGLYTEDELALYLAKNMPGGFQAAPGFGIISEELARKAEPLITQCLGKSKEYAEELFRIEKLPAVLLEPLLNHFGCRTKWKSLTEAEIVKQE